MIYEASLISVADSSMKRLSLMISCISSVTKWKLCHLKELDTWVKARNRLSTMHRDLGTDQLFQGHVALLGDSCHPTLPYQAQGAAMAVEDGAVLGVLLGQLNNCSTSKPGVKKRISSLLKLYETLRKRRTTTITQGSIQNRTLFHMVDGPEQVQRDGALSEVDWVHPCVWQWGDIEYQKKLNGFDAVSDARKAFAAWFGNNGNSDYAML